MRREFHVRVSSASTSHYHANTLKLTDWLRNSTDTVDDPTELTKTNPTPLRDRDPTGPITP